VLDKAEYSAFQSTLNSPIVSYLTFNYIQHVDAKSVTTRRDRDHGTLEHRTNLLAA